jgi:hypothetical protein
MPAGYSIKKAEPLLTLPFLFVAPCRAHQQKRGIPLKLGEMPPDQFNFEPVNRPAIGYLSARRL